MPKNQDKYNRLKDKSIFTAAGRIGSLLMLTQLFILYSCATVKVEMNGYPMPENVVCATLTTSNIRVDSAVVYRYGVLEVDEVLDEYSYLDVSDHKKTHYLNPLFMQSLKIIIHINNPNKIKYKLWIDRTARSSDKKIDTRNYELGYSGNLSRKEIVINLPVEEGLRGRASFNIKSGSGNLLYQGLVFKYKVRGKGVVPTK